ncbi:MAG: hypothetical protein AAF378_23815 [Cyanobacteria bacterium P01_A01_bin.84]
MSHISYYWNFVKVNSNGKCKIEMLTAARAYFKKQFRDSADDVEVADTAIIRQLWQNKHSQVGEDWGFAEICLRCYISQQIYRVCFDLGVKFGSSHSFHAKDLFPLVLDDQITLNTSQSNTSQLYKSQSNTSQSSAYQSLATNVLQTFNPTKGSLKTWISRYVKQHSEIKQFLMQHGVYLISDWALLNDTSLKQLQRILTQMYQLASVEIQQSCELLTSYHAVYREDRLQKRIQGITLPCKSPTNKQLQQISQDLQTRTSINLNTKLILKKLQLTATRLRQYKIAISGGSVASVSFDREEIQPIIESSLASQTDTDKEQIEFMKLYQTEFITSLDKAIFEVIKNYVSHLQRKRKSLEEEFIKGLHLFHCQGKSMSQIAPEIGFKKQYEVTRLLKLNQFRADIRQSLLINLRNSVMDIAQEFTDSDRLQNLDKQIELILDEQISTIIQEAESEVRNPVRNQPLRNLIARRICNYLNNRKSQN